MEYVKVGKSGLVVSKITIGFALTVGTEHAEPEFAQEMVDTAWQLGIRSIDLANMYGQGKAEELVGQALQKYPRQQYIIHTKCYWPMGDSPYERGLSRKHILWAVEESLRRLQMDYIDIYYAHRYDPTVPMEEIVRTYNYLINSGKILYWATSEWPREALEECHAVCEQLNMEKPIAEQFIYSYAVTKVEKNGVKDFCEKNDVGMFGYSPLCQGFLTGKYRNGIPDDSRISKSKKISYDKTKNFYRQYRERIDYFLNISDKYEIPGNHLALLWSLYQGIVPIVGASSTEQLKKNLLGLEKYADNLSQALAELRHLEK